MKVRNYVAAVATLLCIAALSSCKTPAPVASTFEVDKNELTFGAEGGVQQIQVTASQAWEVRGTSGAWFSLSQTSGSGNASIQVTATENREFEKERKGSVTLASNGKNITVSLAQAAPIKPLANDIFSIDFTKGLGSFTIDNKVTAPEIASVWISNNYGAVGSGFNGQNYETESWLVSPEIDLSAYDMAQMSFSHAANKGVGAPADYLKLMATTDGGKTWEQIAIPTMPVGNNWSFVDSGDISLTAFCGKKFQFAFAYRSTKESSFSWEIKTLSIIRSKDGVQAMDNGNQYKAVPKWMELPAVKMSKDFVIHTSLENGSYVRNFSLLNDPKALVALWVAYPQCDFYMKNVSGRTDNWAFDPFIAQNEQPNLEKSGDFFVNGYERGHQIASADRLASVNMNSQTFYYSNMAPMLKQKEFNSGVWSMLEDNVRDWSKSKVHTDTMYVVTGSVVEGSKTFVKDNDGDQVTVPVGFYKALLRYSKSDSSTPEYIGAAYYFEHRNYSMENDYKAYAMSIKDLEEKLGIDFFPNLVEVLGKDEAAKVEAENPLDNAFWWNNRN